MYIAYTAACICNPFTHNFSFSNSPHCLLYSSHDVSWEYLVLDQLINSLNINISIFFILITSLLDVVLIL